MSASIYGPDLNDSNTDFENQRITSLGDPFFDTDAANKKYVDHAVRGRGQHFITVWAETRGYLNDDTYQWSFGGCDRNSAGSGYTMLSAGRIIRIGLTGGSSTYDISVNVTLDDRDNGADYGVTKPAAQKAVTKQFTRPLRVRMGQVINFITQTSQPRVPGNGAVVSLLIQLYI